ncbi:aminoglycoside 6'-N-acetyltransferase [Psychrobacillus sp. OK028]|uniref:GNAT family N-acetyltransferase n=1 Tax=Psychrobacillus sp. OK028 TaxID=1884359 RepID=UPI00088FE55E|nr:GNAT family N-acetyltransferase [Psychrobacillus sp. OK028]SDN47791.1 aminoglycoside 6'-N-acetyltransferase [Psychrobacillus sp. OK028]
MIQINGVSIRAMSESDYPYMEKWLNDDLVIEYYGPRLTLEQVVAKYGPRIKGDHYVKPCIVEYKNKRIGYMQYYRTPKEQLKLYSYPAEESIYGIDQFIGEPGLWGKGLGTKMINALLEYLSSKLGVSKVVLDVDSTNLQAIKCYEKCGFQVVKGLEDNHLLMEWMRSWK